MESDDKTFTIDLNESSKKPGNNEHEAIMSLRIPASTLATVDASTELFLTMDQKPELPASGALRRHGASDESLAVRVEPGATRIFQTSSQQHLVHVGDATRRVAIHPTSTEVKDLGRKARERLEEERRKRREIVRLEEPEKETAAGGSIFADAIRKKKSKATTPKRKWAAAAKSYEYEASEKNVDTWAPDVGHVSLCDNEERTNILRLHGLPQSVKPESIRKFFSGLDVERIFVLVPNKTRIPEWDEDEHHGEVVVSREEPLFRVYVKFVSAPAADMARARSNEFLYVDHHQQEGKVGVRIAMTKIPKPIASYLQQNLAIDGVNGIPLSETLRVEENKLGPKVVDLIWTMTTRDLGLDLSTRTVDTEPVFPWQKAVSNLNPLVFTDYQKLAQHHNSLIDVFEEMEQLRCMDEWDMNKSQDDAVRLRSAATNRLLEEIERLEHMLYRARVERRAQARDKDE